MRNTFFLTNVSLLIFLAACGFQPLSPTIDPTKTSAAVSIPDYPSPEPVNEFRELAEEDLALLIHTSVGEVEAAVDAASFVMVEAVPGDRLTEVEISETLSHIQSLRSKIIFTRRLIDIYIDLYGELADETMSLLLLIDEDLSTIITSSNEVKAILEEDKNNPSVEFNQLNNFLESISNQTAAVNEQTGIWNSDVQAKIEEREKFYANTQPQLGLVVYNRIDAFTQAHDFLDAFNAALSDKKLSLTELGEISQLAATAKASLYNTGDPQLFTFAQQIDELSRLASRGEWQQAHNGLVALEFSMPARPRP